MTNPELKTLLAKVRGSGPASPSAIDSLQTNLSLPLPDDYRRFVEATPVADSFASFFQSLTANT